MNTISHYFTRGVFILLALLAVSTTAFATGFLTIDLPNGSDTGLSSTDNITFKKKPTIDGTASPGSTVRVKIDGSTLCIKSVNASAKYNCPVGSPLPDGVHTAVAHTLDTDRYATVVFVIDSSNTIPPGIPDLHPSTDSETPTDDITTSLILRFTGIGEPGSKIRVMYANNTESFCFVTADPVTGAYDCTDSVSTTGVYGFTARETDIAGNISNPSGTVTVSVIDVPPPPPAPKPSTPQLATSSDSGVSNTDRLTNDSTPTFFGTGVPGMSLYLTAGTTMVATTVCATTVAIDGTWTCTVSPLIGHPQSVMYVIRAHYSVIDFSDGLEIQIDDANVQPTSKPDLVTSSDDGVSNTDNITSKKTVRVWATAENLVQVLTYVNNVLKCTITSTGGGYWSCLFTVPTEGEYQVHTYEIDRAGNMSPISETLTITVVAPLPPVPPVTPTVPPVTPTVPPVTPTIPPVTPTSPTTP